GLWEGICLSTTQDLEYLAGETEGFNLTIIDTLSKATPGVDENSNSEMAEALERAYRLADRWNGFVLIVSHTGKDESKGTRGASALKSNVDTVLRTKRSGKAAFVSIEVDKQKDGPDDLRIDFEMRSHELHNKQTGEITTELVPVPVGVNPSADARIKVALARQPDATHAEVIAAVTDHARRAGNPPVTETAIKTALSRAVHRGDIQKSGGTYSLSTSIL
ncbi:MAG: AAA family ATPase, partial [Pseudomonadota bacterium]|nr:AAA family ATPase [Pseudomonadota bacterium]